MSASKTLPAILLILFMTIFFHVGCNADIKKEMVKFLDDLGSVSNVSGPEIYQGQKAGYATAGGVTIRNKSVNLNPLHVTLPRFEAGCAGIDIFTGGFSFIDDQQLVEALKNIASSTAGYAFMLSLESVSPQIASTMKQMQTWANEVNSHNINSCEAAAGLVGSVWPEDDLASEHICKSEAAQSGIFKDRISNRHQCATRAGRTEAAKNSPKLVDLQLSEYNIVWKAITKNGGLGNDKKLCELLMTLMGTLVVKDGKCEMFLPKAVDENFLKVFMEGGECELYKCSDEDQCLTITKNTVKIEKSAAWKGRVEEILLSIHEKVLNEAELVEEEFDLVARTSIPLYRYITIVSAYKKGICPIEIRQIAEIVSVDLLSSFLREALESVRLSCLSLRQNVPYASKIDDYLKSLKFVENSLNHFEQRTVKLMNQETSILKKMDLLEKYIASELQL